MKKHTIKVEWPTPEISDIAPLLDVDGYGQQYPATVTIYQDKNGETRVVFGVKYESTYTFNVWHNVDIEIPIRNDLHVKTLNSLESDQRFIDLVNTIVQGHSVETRFRDYQKVGYLDEDASDAKNRLEEYLSDEREVYFADVWEAGDWLNYDELYADSGERMTRKQIANLSDDEIDTIVKRYRQEATLENAAVIGLSEHIYSLRDEFKRELVGDN